MILASAAAGLSRALSPAMRGVLVRVLATTLALLIALWLALNAALAALLSRQTVLADNPWLETGLQVIAGAGFLVGLVYLLPAVAALVAGLFLDRAAAIVERTDFPADPPGEDLPLGPSLLGSLRFFGVVLLVNLVALALLLVPVVNVAAFFLANSYLLGREYFELAAARRRSVPEARALRRANRARVWLAGGLIAGFLLIPILNLAAPLFGVALMTHLERRIARKGGG